VWQELYVAHKDQNFIVLTIAQDSRNSDALPFIEAAKPLHPALIDNDHLVSRRYGFINVPTVIWIDEEGRIVRPPRVEHGSNKYAFVHKLDCEPHLNALKKWIATGETDFSPEQTSQQIVPPTFDEQLARAEHALAWYLLAQALRMKEIYPDSIEAARKAIRLTPNNAEPYFWLAESLRLSGKYQDATDSYSQYLRLSDFDSKLAGKMNYYVLGYLAGFGRKKRAAQRDVWKDLRSLAYFGLCDSERLLGRFDSAIGYCNKSLVYDPQDPYSHFALALCYTSKAQASGALEPLVPARKHFATTMSLNAEMAEAERAKKYIARIDALLSANQP